MTVSTGNTELPEVFVVVGFDVTGRISSDVQQDAGFVLFNWNNVSNSYNSTLTGLDRTVSGTSI